MFRLIAIYFFVMAVSCGQRSGRPSGEINEKGTKIDSLDGDVSFETHTARFNIEKGALVQDTLVINVSYAAIGCSCPQWFEIKGTTDTIGEREYFYLEQGDETIANADTLFNGTNLPQVTLTGQFYEKKGYAKNYRPIKGDPKPARVFRYNKIKIIKAIN